MAFRGNQNRNRNFGGNYGPMGGGGANRMGNLTMSPWDTQNPGGNFGGGGGGGGGNMRQGGGGQGMNAQALNLANNLLNNLFRNQNPPSLLDLPRGGAGMGNRNQRGGQMINRGGGNRINNRRIQGGFPNRGTSGVKSNQKPGAGGIRKQNAFDRAKKLLAKNANNKKKDFAPGDKKPESKESPYASVQNDMFYCHLCKKHMWDANSFENHIKGRTHLMMREGIEESYRLKANMIRQEAKIAEQLKSIELDRLKRMGKSKQRQLEYCTMCDLNFHGHISAHRKSEGHLQLKKFLHPKCIECNNEFATRIDYDSHLLSADHLIKAAERNTKVGERKRNTLAILTEEEELKDIRQPQRRRKKPVVPTKKEAENIGEGGVEIKQEPGEGGADTSIGQEANTSGEQQDKTQTGDDSKEGDVGEAKECDEQNETQDDEDISPPVDPENCILDYVDGDEIPTEVENRLPKYNWMRPVGGGLISKVECFECSLCEKFFDSEKTVEIHSRTATHHRNFLKFINEKSSDTKIAQKRASAALEETERKKRRLEEAQASNGQSIKIEETEGDEQEGQVGGEEDNGELYDPSEATGDDEDVEMVENGEEGMGHDCEGGDAEYDDENVGAGCEEDEDEMGSQSVEQSETSAVEAINVPEPTPVIEPTLAVAVQTPKVTAPSTANVAQPEVKSETPIKLTPVKAQANANAAVSVTPSPVANTTPIQNQQEQTSGSKRGGPRGGGGNKPSPRGRGRGRYSRY